VSRAYPFPVSLRCGRKQLITLAVAIIGAVVTFSGTGTGAVIDFKAAGPSVPVALVILLLSIASGFIAFMSLVGALAKDTAPSPYKGSITFFAGLQIIFFGTGVLVLALFTP
jgi:hypothetical protein